MLKPYTRRAFVLLAVLAFEPAVAPSARAGQTGPAAQADPKESLWDVLDRTTSAVIPLPGANNATAQTVRRGIGPVPGFTLPVDSDSSLSGFPDKAKRGSVFGPVGDWFGHLENMTGTKIKASGYGNLSFRKDDISGSDTSYRDEQYYGRGSNGIYTDTDLSIDATLFKYLHYQTRISNSLFKNPNDNRVKLDYNTKKMRFEWGDINAGFQGNSLLDFNRYLHGVRIHNEWGPHLNTTLLYSQTKAETRTFVTQGNGSAGPYFVYAGQIVEGSDHVRIDNRDLVKGTDYTLDTFNGELKFLHGLIALPSSTIAVSYETLGYGQSQGNIMGARTEFAPSPKMHFGLTYVTQTAKGSGLASLLSEEYRGYGQPTFYTTNAPIDLSKPLIITIGSRQLAPNEYKVDNTTTYTNRIFIGEAVDPTTIVRIQYFPFNPTPVPGNRSIMGLDGRLSLGKLGSVTLETALSGLSLTGSNIGGHAWQARADLSPMRDLHTTLTLRDINPTFSSIQSPGFNRNERSVELTSEYNPIKNLKLSMEWQKAKRPAYTGTTQFSVNTIGNDDYNQYNLGATYSLGHNTSISLSRSNLETQYLLGGHSASTSDTLGFNWGWKTLALDASLSHNKSDINSSYSLLGLTTTTDATNSVYDSLSSTLTKHVGLHWQPLRWLSLSGGFSDNAIGNNSAGIFSQTNARNSQFSATITPRHNLRILYTYDLSDTGNLANSPLNTLLNSTTTGSTTTTGTTVGSTTAGSTGSVIGGNVRSAQMMALLSRDLFSSGTNATTSLGSANLNTSTSLTGLYGGGANNSLGSLGNYSGNLGSLYNNYGASSYGGRSSTNRINIEFQPRANLQLGLQLDNSSSVGDYQFNSNRNTVGFNLGWQLSDRMQINGSFSNQMLQYSGSTGGSKSNTMLLSMQGHPFGGKLGIQFSWQSLKTSSAFSFATLTTGSTSSPALTDTSTNLSSLSARVEYPISRRQTLFVEMLRSNTSGYLANMENDFRFGMDYSLTQTLKFSFGWQILQHNYADAQNQPLNYKASSLLAEFGVHF